MSKMIKNHAIGLIYLLSNPDQLRHVILRETRYRRRKQNRQSWVEWQKYDTHSSAGQHSSAAAYARPLNVARIRTFSEMISRIGNGLNVLDVGCGDGVISEPIAQMGNNVASLDLPTITILAHNRNVSSVVAGDAEHLAFATGSFDVILASEVVEHLWNPRNFFDEAYRVLEAAGYLIVETPEGIEGLRYDSHKHYFTVKLLEQMLSEMFSVCEFKRLKPFLGAPTSTIIVLMRKKSKGKN